MCLLPTGVYNFREKFKRIQTKYRVVNGVQVAFILYCKYFVFS